jgi:hypothetical protein
LIIRVVMPAYKHYWNIRCITKVFY